MSLDDRNRMRDDHAYVRQSLTQVHRVLNCHQAPPDGHMYWRILEDALGYLVHDLPLHIAYEEREVFPAYEGLPGAALLAGIRVEHGAILALVAEVAALLEPRDACSAEARWAGLRARAEHLEPLLLAHIENEGLLLRRLAREACACEVHEA